MDPDLTRQFQDARELPHHRGTTFALEELREKALPPPEPLIRPTPRSAMVFPLVVLVAVLPGIAALNSWDLTPPGPMWGLRGLAILNGLVLDQTPAADAINSVREAAAFRAIAYQPPLYGWMEAFAFALSSNHNPIGSILPSYIAGAVAVLLVYLHGRLWQGTGLGLSGAILVGFNHSLLSRMQKATPDTLMLCGILAALLAYGCHQRATVESRWPWRWASPVFWAILGGLSLGVALLSMSGLALIVIPIIAIHQYYLRSDFRPLSRRNGTFGRWLNLEISPGFFDAVLALAVALVVSLPWFIYMIDSHGWQVAAALSSPPYELLPGRQLTLLSRLVALAPVTLPLGLFGAVRAIRRAIVDEFNTLETIGGSFLVIWLALASLTPTVWPTGPQGAVDLVLLVPLNLLAAQTIADLVNRRVSVRTLIGLAPATAISIACCVSDDLARAISNLIHARTDAATALVLHLTLDLIVSSVLIVRALSRWANHRDNRQRQILVAFLAIILVAVVSSGLREVLFRHSETHDLLSLRTMILRRNRDFPFQTLAVVSSAWSPNREMTKSETDQPLPGGRLRFILQTTLPRLPQSDLEAIDDLFNLPEGQRLIILAGTEQRLSSADQLRLGIEAIHPGRLRILNAYATARGRTARR